MTSNNSPEYLKQRPYTRTPDVAIESRQQVRANLRRVAFQEISAQYGGEPRALRRLMAADRMRRDFKIKADKAAKVIA
jgi:hypothetical protein